MRYAVDKHFVVLRLLAQFLIDASQFLRGDLDLTRSSFLNGDAVEGIRARIIDKDNAPRWRFARIEDVSAADVAKMFESPWPAGEHPLRDLRS